MSGLAALRAGLGDVPCSDEGADLEAKSRDYYWYSPILKAQLDDKRAGLVVRPRGEADVLRVAALCARHRVPLTPRGAGTGNYGQAVPLAGGVVLDMSAMNRIISIEPTRARVEAGVVILDLDRAARAGGQQVLMYPSTGSIATIGGFIAGGHSGIGSIRNGILRDPGNVSLIRVVTLEDPPRVIELRDADIQKVHHAYGTNGVITELVVALQAAVEWRHCIARFASYRDTCRFGIAAGGQAVAGALDLYLLSAVEGRIIGPYYKEFDAILQHADAMFALVAPAGVDTFFTLAATFGGERVVAETAAGMAARGLPPVIECAYNHTTLMALKRDRSVTYLQVAFPAPLDADLVQHFIDHFGEELQMHHEFSKMDGRLVAFALPLVQYFDEARIREIIGDFEARGCHVFDPHTYVLEDGGMKVVDAAQIDFKKLADPQGLMNPGKTRGWKP